MQVYIQSAACEYNACEYDAHMSSIMMHAVREQCERERERKGESTSPCCYYAVERNSYSSTSSRSSAAAWRASPLRQCRLNLWRRDNDGSVCARLVAEQCVLGMHGPYTFGSCPRLIANTLHHNQFAHACTIEARFAHGLAVRSIDSTCCSS